MYYIMMVMNSGHRRLAGNNGSYGTFDFEG